MTTHCGNCGNPLPSSDIELCPVCGAPNRYNPQRPSYPPPFSRRRRLFLAIVILLTIIYILIGISIFFLRPNGSRFIPTPVPTKIGTTLTPTPPAAPILLVDLPLASLRIVTEAPYAMEVHQSYIVKATLIPKGKTYISSLTVEKATPTASETTPAGTPGATLGNAFGKGYEPFASATLFPPSGPLDITPISPIEQSLRQQQVVWKWSVVPSEESYGADFLSIDMEVTWKSASGNQGPFPLGEEVLGIKVIVPPPTPTPTPPPPPTPTPEPAVSVAPVKIDIGAILSNLLPYLLGTGGIGLVALLFPRMKRWFAKRRTPASQPKKRNTKKGKH
jgi:hypothetical protein